MSMTRTEFGWTLAIALAVHALVGFHPFPYIDDFAYAVLADLRADPLLFSRDDQLSMFENHAHAYTLVYWLSKATIGVGPGFWLATLALCIGCVFALRSVLVALKAPEPALLIALGLGVLVVQGGIGRGDYGELIADSFHHQAIALCLALWAIAALLHQRPVVAGICLGLAAYAQPVTALLGAATAGSAALFMGADRVRRLAIVAGCAMLIAAPLALIFAARTGPDAGTITSDLIETAYRFRAPAHYDLLPGDLFKLWLALVLGAVSALACLNRAPVAARGLLGAFAALAVTQLVSTFVYAGRQFEWLPFFILDTTRITPLAFGLSGAAAAAVAISALRDRRVDRLSVLSLLLAVGLLVVNATPVGLILIALGAALAILPDGRKASFAVAGLGLVLFAGLMAVRPMRASLPEQETPLFEWVEAKTARDALFVIPPDMDWFRLYAQRSVFVDFKMFSVSQPDQAALTRDRIMQLAPQDAALQAMRGWEAVRAWSDHFAVHANCEGISGALAASGADYYVLRTVTKAGEAHAAPSCPSGPHLVFEGGAYAAYAPVSQPVGS